MHLANAPALLTCNMRGATGENAHVQKPTAIEPSVRAPAAPNTEVRCKLAQAHQKAGSPADQNPAWISARSGRDIQLPASPRHLDAAAGTAAPCSRFGVPAGARQFGHCAGRSEVDDLASQPARQKGDDHTTTLDLVLGMSSFDQVDRGGELLIDNVQIFRPVCQLFEFSDAI